MTNTLEVSAANLLVETEPHQFCACASDLGLTCARIARDGWPMLINVVPGLGNGMHFRPVSRCVSADGDLLHVRYRQSMGCVEIKIFND
jgi:hypothetical protein